MRRWFTSALAAAICLLAAHVSAQEEQQEEWDGGYDDAAERRSGFTAGLGTALALGKVRGYPNVAGQIKSPDYEQNTGFAVGSDYNLWIGGALKDWFTFGVGFDMGGMSGNDLVATGWAFFFRVETFPLFYQGGFFRDLGVQANFGVGSDVILDADEEEVANGGAISLIGVGAVWEGLRFGSFAAGPTLEYRLLFSESYRQHTGLVGFRLAFYGGP